MTDPVEARFYAGPAGAIEQPGGPITALPDELLTHVFSFCDPQALRRCAQVCRRWDAISGDEQVWRKQPITNGAIIVNGPAPELVGAEGLKKFCEWYLDFEGLHDEKFGRPGGNDFELENEALEIA